MREFKHASVTTDVYLGELAENIGFQAGIKDGPTYAEIIRFIQEIDYSVADSEFTRQLHAMVKKQYRETLDERPYD